MDCIATYPASAYVRLVGECVAATGLRRMKAVLLYRRIRNFRAVQLLLAGHSKIESTVRYVGIETHER